MTPYTFHCSVLIITLLLSIPAAGASQNPPRDNDEYEISFTAYEDQTLQVLARLTLADSLLYMSQAGPVPERWPQYIRNLNVQDENGRPLTVTETADGGWVLPGGARGQRVQATYELSLTHEEIEWPGGIDGVAYQRDWGVFCTGRALFIMNGKEKGDIHLRFREPEGWRVSAPWDKTETGGQWIARGLRDLSESILFAGTHEELLLEHEGFALKFVLGGKGITRQKEVYAERAGQLMDYYTDLMGGLPQPPPGQEFSTVMVVINAGKQMDGEVIGNHISMFVNPEGDPQGQMMAWFMFAHEFFHLWNGKTLQVSSTRADWFKEGVTNYYTMKALHQIGFVDEGGVLAILNNLFYQRYINDPGLGELSIEEAGSTFQKDRHWGLVYGGGLFVGISLDMIIRNHTGNKQSLDVLMRNFYERYGGTDQGYSTEDIIAEASRLSGQDLQRFAEQYIRGTAPAPLQQYLAYAGIQVITEGGQLQLKVKDDQTELEKQVWMGFLGE